MDALDDEWIKQYETYNDFYTDDVFCVNLSFIYINDANEINKIKEEKFLLRSPNFIEKDDILTLVKKNTICDSKEYFLYSLAKINIDLDPNEIRGFLSKDTNQYATSFLSENNELDEIVFKKTINMFQDLNDLVFLLKEKPKHRKPCNRFTRRNKEKL